MKPIPTSLIPRLLSTLTLWMLIIVTVVTQSENGYSLLIAAAALGSLWEYFWLLKVALIPRHWRLGYFAGIILLLGNFWLLRNPHFGGPLRHGGGAIFIFEGLLLALLVLTLFTKTLFSLKLEREAADAITFTLLGIIYIPWLFSFVSKIIYLTPRDTDGTLTGQYYVLFLLVVTKFTDVGAFICGSFFGRHPFFSHVSSTKTKEGCIGALFFSLLSGWLFFIFFQKQLPLLHPLSVIIISMILGIIAIAGDLAESLLKRTLQTKDSSNTLPGIGGGLDLIDSILFTAPIFYFILQGLIFCGY
jgi:phosphatidate cytidylyltransferase